MTTILIIVAAVLAGAVVALKRVAPATKTKVDDKILEIAEPASEALDGLIKK